MSEMPEPERKPGGETPPSTSGGTPDATPPHAMAAEAIPGNLARNEDGDHLVSGLHFRGKLPHLKRDGAIYFVTFRLNDSLPGSEIVRLKLERAAMLEQARAAKRPLTWHEEEQLLAWYCEKVELLLDAGRGACWLHKPEIAELVGNAINFFDGKRYDLRAWVIMPNHVHAIVWPYPGRTLSEILHSWKSYTSKEANKLLGRTGQTFWQAESFDHVIRNEEERVRLVNYVENNPAKAGLCKGKEDWKWSSACKGGVRRPA
jgi:REP element-mobilizing transposase RayT